MDRTVTLPLWAAVVLAVLAAWAALDRLMVPSFRWLVRQRTNRVIEELNTRLPFEIPPFKLTKRQVLIDRLVYDPRVVEAAEAHARQHGMPREVAMTRVERYAHEIVPSFNAYLYFRVGYWLARRTARLLYRVRLGWSDEEGLSRISRNATVVFVMNHRSNMDYVLVGYLASRRAALSYAVGEWARIWPLHMLIRSMGAYFVRRGSGDDLYRRVLERYVFMATQAGVTQAVYPEGGLTRDGALRAPKLGLIDYILRAFDPAGERDLVFVPVGINYDRVLEDRTLLAEAAPDAPRPGRAAAARRTAGFVLHNLWLMARSRWYRFGYACACFGSPISMRAYCAERGVDFRALQGDARRARMEEMGAELMRAVGAAIPVLPVSLVSTAVLRAAEPLSELELKARVLALAESAEAAGARVYVPRRDLDYAVAVGLRTLTLRRLVAEEEGLFRAAPGEEAVLRYYARSIAHLLPDEVPPAVVPFLGVKGPHPQPLSR
jgi:glycerol-3-phosphate O-acyltransferase